MNRTASIPLTEMTQEQLIRHIERLEIENTQLRGKTGEEVLRQNERLWADVHRHLGVLDEICRILHHHGFETPNDRYIWGGVSRMGQRMKAAEKHLRTYGQHLPFCGHGHCSANPCTCGLDEVLSRLPASEAP